MARRTLVLFFTVFIIIPAIAFCSTKPSMEIISTDLIGHWGLDEKSGFNAYDTAGDHNGTLKNFGGSPWMQGPVGGALSFDGINDYISIGNLDTYDNLERITISAWINLTKPVSDRHFIFGKEFVFKIDLEYQKVRFLLGSKWENWSDDRQISSTKLSLNQWYHVAATYDGQYKRIYINGENTDTMAAPIKGGIGSSKYDMTIGSHYSSKTGYFKFFKGGIDDVRIYDRALSAKEIQKIQSLSSRVESNPSDLIDARIEKRFSELYQGPWIYKVSEKKAQPAKTVILCGKRDSAGKRYFSFLYQDIYTDPVFEKCSVDEHRANVYFKLTDNKSVMYSLCRDKDSLVGTLYSSWAYSRKVTLDKLTAAQAIDAIETNAREINRLKEALAAAQAKTVNEKKQKDQLQRRINKFEAVIAGVKAQNDVLNNDLDELNKKYAVLEQGYNRVVNEKRVEIGEMRKECKKVIDQLAETKNTKIALEKKHNFETQKNNKIIKDLQQKNDISLIKIDILKKSQIELNRLFDERARNYQLQKMKSEKESKELKGSIAEYRVETEKMNKLNRNLEEQLDEAKKAKIALEKDFNIQSKKNKKAISELRKERLSGGNRVRRLRQSDELRGHILKGLLKHDNANDMYTEVIKKLPGTQAAMAAQAGIAFVHLKNRNDAQVLAAYDKLVNEYKGLPRYDHYTYIIPQEYWDRAEGASLKGDKDMVKANYTLALTLWEKVDVKDLGSFLGGATLYSLGRCYGMTGDDRKAIENYERLAKDYPKSNYVVSSLHSIPRHAAALKKDPAMVQEAEVLIEKYHLELINKHPDSRYIKQSLKSLAMFYYRKGQYAQALKRFEQLVEKDEKERGRVGKMMDVCLERVKGN